MSKIRGKNTKIEVTLRKGLWREGIKGYRLHLNLPGKPDIVFTKYKIAIFCDGDFWHGFKFSEWCNRLSPYWLKKISDNMNRDLKNDKLLQETGWLTIHFWEHEIEKNVNACITKIKITLQTRGSTPK